MLCGFSSSLFFLFSFSRLAKFFKVLSIGKRGEKKGERRGKKKERREKREEKIPSESECA